MQEDEVFPVKRPAGWPIRGLWRWIRNLKRQVVIQRRQKNLRLSEMLSFGEKRFVAVVQVAGEKFLVGGTGQSICLLARLQDANPNIDAAKSGEKEFIC